MPKTTKYESQRREVQPPSIGLADLRKSHRMTQAEVANQVAAIIDKPYDSGTLSTVEGGHRGASLEVLSALEQVFGLAPGALLVSYAPSHDRRKRQVA